jgi:UDP-glucose 4-epimerase
MRVIVTGGAGFIGANLCRELTGRADVDEVVAFDNVSTGSAENLAGVDGVKLVEGDLCDPAAISDAVAGADSIVHLGARPSVPRSIDDPMATHDANVTGTLDVLEAARQAGAHVVIASSSSVYGANPALPKVETLLPQPRSPYAASKLATEGYALAYRESFGVPSVVFRFFNVYGPLQAAGHAYAAVIPAFVDAALRGEPLPVHGDGGQTRDFTYVGTVTRVLTDAALRGVDHAGPVNLAFGSRISLRELIGELEHVLGRALEVDHQPTRPGDVRDSQADNALLRELFPGVDPVPLPAGLEATVGWFRGESW